MSQLIVSEIAGKEGAPVYFPSGIRMGNTGAGGINDIGIPGQPGFGVGIAPALPDGMTALPGYTDVLSDNYGNYQYSDGSIMVWVPAFYYKYGTGANGLAINACDIKNIDAYTTVTAANAAGYALHRAFYDGGQIKQGFFVDKYLCSNNSGVASSLRNGAPISSSASNSPVADLDGVSSNINASFITAASLRGTGFFCQSIFIFKAMALLSYAHGQAATSPTYCAWYDAAGITNFPKGCNNNALGDVNDNSLSFTSSGYDNAALTGSANFLAKTTHNGQVCGVADLNGCMWDVCPGLTMDDGDESVGHFYVLKTSVAMADVTAGTSLATDLWGATGYAALYDDLGVMDTFTSTALNFTDRTVDVGSVSKTFSEATSGTLWQMTGAGIPVESTGTNVFGNDRINDYSTSQMLPSAGGSWSHSTPAGVWALGLSSSRASLNPSHGFRAALYL
ncbi:hypothetical protein [Zhongshania marina]|uniref:Uncharacterized protein n=1 Tax=Zhongshania marina TaxID=2304603 RepID=A0A2S4HGE4_9GAMM|nr:hypothetical protein [Marortus luteolus]POP53056.1 hypothetical protein C0068_08165 [Marortus luteolus]